MKTHPTKETSVNLRTTQMEKEWLRNAASRAGLSITDFLLNAAHNHISIAPQYGRQAMCLLHALHLQCLDFQRQGVDTHELQNKLSKIALVLQDQLDTFQSKTDDRGP